MLMIERGSRTSCRKHRLDHRLREEDRAAQVGGDDRVEILRRQIKEIAAHHRADAGIVDEAVDAAELSQHCRIDCRLMPCQRRQDQPVT